MDDERATTAPDGEETVGLDGADGLADDDRFDDPVPRPPIEPESVDIENAAFVVLGALLTVGILVASL